MYSIKAHFDGEKITPNEPFPVHKPYEAIVTFTEPVKKGVDKTKRTILDILKDGPVIDDETFNNIMDDIRIKREPYGRYSNDLVL
jgi:hypothetical protein